MKIKSIMVYPLACSFCFMGGSLWGFVNGTRYPKVTVVKLPNSYRLIKVEKGFVIELQYEEKNYYKIVSRPDTYLSDWLTETGELVESIDQILDEKLEKEYRRLRAREVIAQVHTSKPS